MVLATIPLVDSVFPRASVLSVLVSVEHAADPEHPTHCDGCYLLCGICREQGGQHVYLSAVGCGLDAGSVHCWDSWKCLLSENGWDGVYFDGHGSSVSGALRIVADGSTVGWERDCDWRSDDCGLYWDHRGAFHQPGFCLHVWVEEGGGDVFILMSFTFRGWSVD